MRSSPALLWVVTALLLGSGVAHGLMTARWQPADKADLADHLARMPMTVAGWAGEELDGTNQADGVASVVRRYTNPATKRGVVVSLTYGIGREASVHTPDICYAGAGYSIDGQPARRSVNFADGRTAEFWAAAFRKDRATESQKLFVNWAWSTDGRWQAPDSPRLTFAAEPRLYKLYVQYTQPDGKAAEREYADFTAGVLEAVNATFMK